MIEFAGHKISTLKIKRLSLVKPINIVNGAHMTEPGQWPAGMSVTVSA